jgi:hypothetical protein
MTLEEFLKFQLENIEGITAEELKNSPEKKFFSGRDIEVGDKVLIGVILENDTNTGLPVTMIKFHQDEIGTVYDKDKEMTKDKIGIDLPILKKIK